MIRKTMAVLIAMAMCGGLAACGSVGEEKAAESTADETVTSAADVTVSDSTDENVAPDENSGETDVQDIKNIFIQKTDPAAEDLTDDEARQFIRLAMAQYEAMRQNDKSSYFRVADLSAAADPIADMVLAEDTDYEDWDDAPQKNSVVYTLAFFCSQMTGTVGYDIDENGLPEDKKQLIKDAMVFGEPDDERFAALQRMGLDFESAVDSCIPAAEIGDDALYVVKAENFCHDGDDSYIRFDLEIYDGDKCCKAGAVTAAVIGGRTCGITLSAGSCDSIYAGMTNDEITAKLSEDTAKMADEQAEAPAKTAYYLFVDNVLANADAWEEGSTLSDCVPAMTSDEGIDLAGDPPEARYDRLIYDKMRESGTTVGRVAVEGGSAEEMTVCYTAENGETVKFPEYDK